MCVDEGVATELSHITDDPSKPLDISNASSEVRQRAAMLYSLLAGLVRNRALSIVRAAPDGDGFEALRQITFSTRPNTSQGTGFAIKRYSLACVCSEQTSSSATSTSGRCL